MEEDTADLESASTPSNNSANRAKQLTQQWNAIRQRVARLPAHQAALGPQLLSPPLFAPWSEAANLRGIVRVHKDCEACPYAELKAAIEHPTGPVPGEKDFFLAANDDLLSQLEDLVMPLESIATQVFQAGSKLKSRGLPWCGRWLD